MVFVYDMVSISVDVSDGTRSFRSKSASGVWAFSIYILLYLFYVFGIVIERILHMD